MDRVSFIGLLVVNMWVAIKMTKKTVMAWFNGLMEVTIRVPGVKEFKMGLV